MALAHFVCANAQMFIVKYLFFSGNSCAHNVTMRDAAGVVCGSGLVLVSPWGLALLIQHTRWPGGSREVLVDCL